MIKAFGCVVAAGLVAAAMAACSPGGPVAGNEEKSGEWVRSEFLKMENSGTAMGEIYAALRTAEPEIYEKFIDAATRNIASGKPPAEAGFAAGAEIRPLYLERFVELGKTAADDDINEMIDFSGEQMSALMAIDPQLCVIVAMGGADPRIMDLPEAVREQEMHVMARILRAGEQGNPGANAEELETWIIKFAGENPAAAEALALIGMPSPTPEQARAICEGNIAMTEALGQEEPTTRARLFRGLLQQS